MVALSLSGVLAGCGSQNPTCAGNSPVLAVAPATATADHTATAPGNQQQFIATSRPAAAGPDCAVPNVIEELKPTWTVSDTLHVSISNANDATNGVATCLGPTTGAATVTATVGSGASVTKLTASLTCK